MNGMADFDISGLLGSLYRRKYFVGCVGAVIFSLGLYTAAILPNIYQSNSLILVVPQRVPSTFVTSTITTDLGERMQSIIQEILSRTQLAKNLIFIRPAKYRSAWKIALRSSVRR
jgi:uncharacterized protein involved in exopolysaccharide biosynthesis